MADHCKGYILARTALQGISTHVRLVQYLICSENQSSRIPSQKTASSPEKAVELHIVLFPATVFPIAKQFWQHTGLGISSRLAEHCITLLNMQRTLPFPASPQLPTPPRSPFKALNKHYAAKPKSGPPSPRETGLSNVSSTIQPRDILSKDQDYYIEERYGRSLPLSAEAHAKRALRRRIADVLVHDTMDDGPQGPSAGALDAQIGPSRRAIEDVTEDDVFLYPTGMAAIWNAHQLSLAVGPVAKCVCFGCVHRLSLHHDITDLQLLTQIPLHGHP